MDSEPPTSPPLTSFQHPDDQFPLLVRPTPLYHRAYRAIQHPQRTHPNLPPSTHQQPSLYDNSLATFTVPSDLSPWAGPLDLNGAIQSPASSLYSEQALAPPPIKQEEFIADLAGGRLPSPSPNHPYLTISPAYLQQHQQPQQTVVRSFSPHVFQRPPSALTPSTPPSNASNSGSPSPASASSLMHTFTVAPQQPNHGVPIRPTPHHAPKSQSGEPADAPWNLVPYNHPWKMRNGQGGAAPPPNAGGMPMGQGNGPSVVAGANGLFLRSPTPTKRQRTNQACEKCRDRKAKVS